MFFYKDGFLHIGNAQGASTNLRDLARDLAQKSEDPFYVYDMDGIATRTQLLKEALSPLQFSLHYAMKANSNKKILQLLNEMGTGVDTVSLGEIRKALEAGFKPQQVIFSGVGKTRKEITEAIQLGIKQINVESSEELRRVSELASALNKETNVAFRLNPDVNPQTHPYITTGFRENKFGMTVEALPELIEILTSSPLLRLRGLTIHIGSQLHDLLSLEEAIQKMIPVFQKLRSQFPMVDRFDVGGGLGVHYETADESKELELIKNYGALVTRLLAPLNQGSDKCEVLLEPGRILVARSGLLISEIQYVKSTDAKIFLIVNTGMHHFIRPALYQAKHRVLSLQEQDSSKLVCYDVVGPICESADFIAKDVELPKLSSGQFLAIADTGAYGFSMASHYNSRPLPKEILFRNGTVES